jgi:SAM-dependent methyltransferase
VGDASDEDDEVARVIQRIRQRVGPGLTAQNDQELLQHFQPAPPPHDDGVPEQLLQQIAELRHLRHALPPFNSGSRIPGGRQFHRLVGRSVRRDTAVLAEQIDLLANQIAATLEGVFAALTSLVAQRNDHEDQARAAERARFVDSLDRLWSSHETLVHEQQKQRALAAEFQPEFSSLDFAERFRGSRDDMLLRYADVADMLAAAGGPVLDLGCGRGELVELIVTKGCKASGVEVDPELVAFCRSIFLDVTECSALDALKTTDDESLGGIALIQVVEHLSAQDLATVIPLAYRKLRPGGLFVAETVNGTSPFVFTRSFYADPTHTNPVHHEYLRFLLEESGFADTKVEWRSLVDKADRVGSIPEGPYKEATPTEKKLVKDTNARMKKLDEFLFAPQDYLIVARK